MRLTITILASLTTLAVAFANDIQRVVSPNLPDQLLSETMEGKCIVMNLPGDREGLFKPCSQEALHLIIEKDGKKSISVLRTQTEGRFEVNIPRASSWKLVPSAKGWEEKVEILGNHDGTKKIVVILKPDTFMTAEKDTPKPSR